MRKLSQREGGKLADRLVEPVAPGWWNPPHEPQPVATDRALAEVDDRTARYVESMRAPFECLRQAEAQLAGLMVLAAASGQAVAGHPMLALAAAALDEAGSGIRPLPVPARARHHNLHVRQALLEIGLALDAARRCVVREDEHAVDAVIRPLKSAHQHLLWATGALPGFEIVALAQACCAQHAPGPSQRP